MIYGFNTRELHKGLWQELNNIVLGINFPWIIIGDFNVVLSPQDRQAGNAVIMVNIKDFQECIQNIRVIELPWKGNYYSWSNKQNVQDIISSRIDRAFGNYERMVKWGMLLLNTVIQAFLITVLLLSHYKTVRNARM